MSTIDSSLVMWQVCGPVLAGPARSSAGPASKRRVLAPGSGIETRSKSLLTSFNDVEKAPAIGVDSGGNMIEDYPVQPVIT